MKFFLAFGCLFMMLAGCGERDAGSASQYKKCGPVKIGSCTYQGIYKNGRCVANKNGPKWCGGGIIGPAL